MLIDSDGTEPLEKVDEGVKPEDQRSSLGENASSSQSSGFVCLSVVREVGEDGEEMRRRRTDSVGLKC